MYRSLGIPWWNLVFFVSLSTFLELFGVEVLETFEFYQWFYYQSNSPVGSTVFWITLFEVVLSAFVADYLVWLIIFLAIFTA